MAGFRRSQTTTQSLICSNPGCSEKATDMCVEHMATFCSKHYQAHVDGVHDGKPPAPLKKKV